LFWQVISHYNQHTLLIQLFFCAALIGSVIFAIRHKAMSLPKLALAASNLYVGIVFFFVFDRSPVGLYFAGPLFLLVGALFLYDGLKYSQVPFNNFSGLSLLVLVITVLYPLVSYLLGHHYPAQVLYILPCPLISLSILLYLQYPQRSAFLMVLMIIWALTGVKAFIFNVLEDLILLIVGIYAIYRMVTDKKQKLDAES
jgi:hypothetical protein